VNIDVLVSADQLLPVNKVNDSNTLQRSSDAAQHQLKLFYLTMALFVLSVAMNPSTYLSVVNFFT
jgi:hypothetical protein